MSNMIDDQRDLLSAIAYVKAIAYSEAPPESIYDRVFSINSNTIRPLLDKLGIEFNYYDPDTTYEEDVRAYINAISEVYENVIKEVNNVRFGRF